LTLQSIINIDAFKYRKKITFVLQKLHYNKKIMGEVEIIANKNTVYIHSNILTYGTCSSPELNQQLGDEIETMWNEANGVVNILNKNYRVEFVIKAYHFAHVTKQDIQQNNNPKNNYFRLEEFHEGNISFVDDINSNTGYWLLQNLYKGSTTAAHEYGHTIGLLHPDDCDLRNSGTPGIMYPRGTLVNAQYQYDPTKQAGESGGTMHPMHRKVFQNDIDLLHIPQLSFNVLGKAIIGAATNIWHPKYTG
jgi:hypothetical protein